MNSEALVNIGKTVDVKVALGNMTELARKITGE